MVLGNLAAARPAPRGFRRIAPPLKTDNMKISLGALLLGILVVATAGCSADQSPGGRISGQLATVFSSLPLQGPRADQTRSIVNAQKLALRDAGGRAGKFKLNFAFADDATARGSGGAPGWDADRVAANARGAVQNSRTIAYIGDLDSRATAISLPITNAAGIVQVSPGSTATGLTRSVVGVDKGEPDKYYPSGDQTFARVVPADDVQGSAAARWAKRLGSERIYLLGDKSFEGNGLVEQFRREAERIGLTIVEKRTMDPRASDYPDLAATIASSRPDTVYFGGEEQSNALALWRDLHRALPQAKLIGSDGLLVPAFYSKLSASHADMTYITSSVQDPSQLPGRGQSFLRNYRTTFGSPADPYAAYGYAAMQLVLDAIARAGEDADQRQEVTDAVLATRELDSPVGRFSIDANGDTSLNRIAGYRIRDGRPRFAAALRGSRGPAQPQR
jgi:branched-chain amino acid transport system substrate-binding protein